MGSTSARDLAHSLHVWLMNEMQYDASGADGYHMIPTPENLAELFCGTLPEVWKYLMENVYGSHSIHAIKGNLQLSRGTSSKKLTASEEKGAQSRRDSAARSVRQVTSSIQHLQAEISKLEEEIVRKRGTLLERRETVRREQRLATCHRLHSQQCQAETRRVSQLSRQLTQMSAGEEEAAQDEADDLQNACMRQIEGATCLLAGHIDRSLEQAPTADSLAGAERAIQRTVRRRPPAEILRSFAGLQQRAGLQLTQQLQQTAEPPAADEGEAGRGDGGDEVTHKIQRSVDELHALHVTWRVSELTQQAEAQQLRRQLNQLQRQLSDSQAGGPDWAALHLEAAAARGRAVAMESGVRQLSSEVESLAEARASLEQRYATILHNQETIDKNKSHIQLLVALGRDSLTLTRTAQQRAASAAQRQLAPLLTALMTTQQQLADDVSREAEGATRWLLQDVRFITVDRRVLPAARLSLLRAPSDDASQLARRLRSACSHLLAALDAEEERQCDSARAHELSVLRETAAAATGTAEQLEESGRRVQSQMEHERTQLMPQLEKLFVNMAQMGGALKHARTALQNWTEQPARTACLQVEHAGAPLKQWEQRLMVATAGAPPQPRPAVRRLTAA